jgi:hypothetical protein
MKKNAAVSAETIATAYQIKWRNVSKDRIPMCTTVSTSEPNIAAEFQ